MSELDYIGADELVFNNDKVGGIHSGGFSVKSIMMKAGMSPIMTLNSGQLGGANGSEKVSDLFNDLVVPNWTLSYNNRITGGKYKEVDHEKDDSDEDDVVDDDLHERLLELVKQHNTENKAPKKKMTRRMKKNVITKKRLTKRAKK